MKRFFDILKDNRGFVDNSGDDEEEEVIIETEDEDEETGDVEVDLDEKDEGEDEDTPPKAKAKWAAMRAENKELKKAVDNLTSSVNELKETRTQQVDTTPVPKTDDAADPRNWTEEQWDNLAKTDWKKAVDLRSKLQAEEIQLQSTHTAEFNKTLEESKQKVLSRHPELNDPNSEKAKIYRNIVVANPDYTQQKKGPLTAMYEMEEYLEKNMGWKREDIVKAELAAREDERARQSRVQLTSTTGHNLSEGNKVTLTKDEMDFCKLQGIDPKVYATNKKKLAGAGKGGIQL
jgi:hypothetical protein